MTKKIWQIWTEEHNGYFNVKFEGSKNTCNKYYKDHGGEKAGYHMGYDISDGLFNSIGEFIGNLPAECVKDCTIPGQDASKAVEEWVVKLEFTLPSLKMGREYLEKFGSWDDLESVDMFTLANRILWIACNEIKESGLWLGLIH